MAERAKSPMGEDKCCSGILHDTWFQNLSTFSCLTYCVYSNIRRMLNAVRLQCSGYVHRKNEGQAGRFVGSSKSWQKVPGLKSACGMTTFQPAVDVIMSSAERFACVLKPFCFSALLLLHCVP